MVSIQVATNVIITCVLDISMTFFITNECFVFHLAKIYFFRIMQVVSRRLPHQTPNKPHEPLHISLHDRLLQRRHVLFPSLHGNNHPGVAGGHELAVPKKRHEGYCLLRKFVFLRRFITLSTKGCNPDLYQPRVREASLGVLSQPKP